MIRINLLPWREELRAEHKKQFLVSLALSVVIALLIIGGFHFSVSQEISYQQARNTYLTQTVQEMNREIQTLKKINVEKEQLLQNLSLIQDLNNSKFEVVGVLDELVQLVPKQVHFTKIDRHKNRITLEGTATSNEKITQLMRNINQAKWLTDPELQEIHTDDLDPAEKDFKLVVMQRGSTLTLKADEDKRGHHGV